MLDAYIIDDIKRREERRRRERDRPRLELPLEEPRTPPSEKKKDEEENDRGIVEIDYSVAASA